MTDPRPIEVNDSLMAWECWEGWWSLLTAGLRDINGASVEGTPAEMRELASAILARGRYRAKRCAVDATGDRVLLWSPRNSIEAASVPYARAEELARSILAEVPA